MGLPYIDAKKQDVTFLRTFWGYFEDFTKKEVTVSKLAREDQGMIGHPYERDFKSSVSNIMIQNFPIIASAVINSHTMFVPNLIGTMYKTVQLNPDRVVMDYIALPKDFSEITQVCNYRGRCDICKLLAILNWNFT